MRTWCAAKDSAREFANGLDTARKLWLVNFDRRFAADPVAA